MAKPPLRPLARPGRRAVLGARLAYALPYFPARGNVTVRGGVVRYRLHGWRSPRRRVRFRATYRPASAVARARPGSLEHWLVERYRLYTVDRGGRTWFADIHHRPWPLQRAAGTVVARDVAAAGGVALPDGAPLLHYADRLDVVVWPPRRAGAERQPPARAASQTGSDGATAASSSPAVR